MGLHDDGLFDETATWYNMIDMMDKVIDNMEDDMVDNKIDDIIDDDVENVIDDMIRRHDRQCVFKHFEKLGY